MSHVNTNQGTSDKDTGYVLFAQANLRKQPQASVELIQYLNSAMKKYKFNGSNGFLNNSRRLNPRQHKPQPAATSIPVQAIWQFAVAQRASMFEGLSGIP